MGIIGKRYAFLAAVFLAASLSFSGCGDEKDDDIPQTKIEEGINGIGTLPRCQKAGKRCGSSMDCCGIGVCNNGVCNDFSCIQNGENCNSTADCCEASAICVSPGFCR